MARKRDHRAEYQRRKAKAQAAGFQSERQYKSARRKSRDWSETHSRKSSTRLPPRADADTIGEYYRAFVAHPEDLSKAAARRERNKRIHDYLVPKFLSQREWEEKYPPKGKK